jgi:hypothetical protein
MRPVEIPLNIGHDDANRLFLAHPWWWARALFRSAFGAGRKQRLKRSNVRTKSVSGLRSSGAT